MSALNCSRLRKHHRADPGVGAAEAAGRGRAMSMASKAEESWVLQPPELHGIRLSRAPEPAWPLRLLNMGTPPIQGTHRHPCSWISWLWGQCLWICPWRALANSEILRRVTVQPALCTFANPLKSDVIYLALGGY